MLALVYVLIFLLELVLLVRAWRRRRGFGPVVILNLCSAAAAIGAMGYFDGLSAENAMAGWAYFPEVFSSLCAGAAFALLMLVSAASWLLRKK